MYTQTCIINAQTASAHSVSIRYT